MIGSQRAPRPSVDRTKNRAAMPQVLGRRLSRSQGLRPTRRIGVSTTVMRCAECGLVFTNPLPTPHDIGQHYDTRPEHYWKPHYFEAESGYFFHQIETFRPLRPGDGRPVALDVGAGIGKCMRSLTAHGFEAHGLEPSAAFRQAAIDRGGIDPDRLTLGAIEEASYEPGTFDFVTFGAVLEHLPDPAGCIERAMTWLASGGLLYVEVPSADWLTARLVNLVYRVQGLDYVANLARCIPHITSTSSHQRAFAATRSAPVTQWRWRSGTRPRHFSRDPIGCGCSSWTGPVPGCSSKCGCEHSQRPPTSEPLSSSAALFGMTLELVGSSCSMRCQTNCRELHVSGG